MIEKLCKIGKNNISKVFIIILSIFLLFELGNIVHAKVILQVEDEGITNANTYIIDYDDSSPDDIKLQFGQSINAVLKYDVVSDEFDLNKDVNFNQFEAKNFVLERGTEPPLPATATGGQLFYDFDDEQIFYFDSLGNDWEVLGKGSDATTIDGIDSTELLRSNIEDVYAGTGTLIFASGTTLDIDDATVNLDEITNDILILDSDNSATGQIALQFGQTLDKVLQYDILAGHFEFDDDVSLNDNELKDFRVENLSSAPPCDSSVLGKQYFNTYEDVIYICTSSGWEQFGGSGISGTGRDLATLQARRASAYSVGTAWADVILDTTDIETNTGAIIHDDVNTDRIIIKQKGFYKITYIVQPQNSGGSAYTMYSRMRLNDTTVMNGSNFTNRNYQYEYVPTAAAFIAELNTNDFISFQLSRAAASTIDTTVVITITKLDGIKGDRGEDGEPGQQGAAGTGAILAAVQVRRSTGGAVPSSWIDVPFDQTDVETYDGIIEHNDINTDRIDVKEKGLYRITYGFTIENPSSNGTPNVDARVRVNDTSVINGSLGTSGLVRYDTVALFDNHFSHTFLTEFSANDFISLQVQRNTAVNIEANVILTIVKLDGIKGEQGDSGITDHGLLLGLTDDDHPQYLPLSGVRSMTGSLNVGDNEIIDFRIENVSSAPVCNSSVLGKKYFNTTDDVSYICTAAGWIQETNTGTGASVIILDLAGGVRGSIIMGTVAGGNSPVLRADPDGNSRSGWSFPVPNDWVSGTDMVVEMYWSSSNTNTGNARWQFRYAAKADGEIISGGDFTTIIYEQAAPGTSLLLTSTDDQFTIPESAISADDMINIHINRQGGHANDTLIDDANIHMVKVKYIKN